MSKTQSITIVDRDGFLLSSLHEENRDDGSTSNSCSPIMRSFPFGRPKKRWQKNKQKGPIEKSERKNEWNNNQNAFKKQKKIMKKRAEDFDFWETCAEFNYLIKILHLNSASPRVFTPVSKLLRSWIQGTARLLWNSMVHRRVHNKSKFDSVLRQMTAAVNLLHILKSYFFRIHFNIVILSISGAAFMLSV
jgi:hypothetical protein